MLFDVLGRRLFFFFFWMGLDGSCSGTMVDGFSSCLPNGAKRSAAHKNPPRMKTNAEQPHKHLVNPYRNQNKTTTNPSEKTFKPKYQNMKHHTKTHLPNDLTLFFFFFCGGGGGGDLTSTTKTPATGRPHQSAQAERAQ